MGANSVDGLGVAVDDHVELPLERALQDDVVDGPHVHVAVVAGGPLRVQRPSASRCCRQFCLSYKIFFNYINQNIF